MQKPFLTTMLAIGVAAASLTSCSRANYAFNPTAPSYLGAERAHTTTHAASVTLQATASTEDVTPVAVVAEAHQVAAALAHHVSQPAAAVVRPVRAAVAKVPAKLTHAEKKALRREQAAVKAPAAEGKSQIVAAILSFFLGGLGIDRFYLGYTGIGILKLLTFGVFGILALIDFIRIIIGDLKPKGGDYTTKF